MWLSKALAIFFIATSSFVSESNTELHQSQFTKKKYQNSDLSRNKKISEHTKRCRMRPDRLEQSEDGTWMWPRINYRRYRSLWTVLRASAPPENLDIGRRRCSSLSLSLSLSIDDALSQLQAWLVVLWGIVNLKVLCDSFIYIIILQLDEGLKWEDEFQMSFRGNCEEEEGRWKDLCGRDLSRLRSTVAVRFWLRQRSSSRRPLQFYLSLPIVVFLIYIF